MADNIIAIKAELPVDLYEKMVQLADRRRVSANTILQQALETEIYLADKEEQGAKVLIEGTDKSFTRIRK